MGRGGAALHVALGAELGHRRFRRPGCRRARAARQQGAAFVGLNPLHALFPGNPWQFSPYSPSSRHFLNVLYIAVERVAGVRGTAPRPRRSCMRPDSRPSSRACARRRASTTPAWRRRSCRILKLLHAHFRRDKSAQASARAARFQAYRAERGESLRRHALHDAIDEHLRAHRWSPLLGLADVARGTARSGARRRAGVRAGARGHWSSSMPGCSGLPTNNWARRRRSAASSACRSASTAITPWA